MGHKRGESAGSTAGAGDPEKVSMSKSKPTKDEIKEATARLKEWLKPGDTVNCILRSVSRSGMSRVISFYKGDSRMLDYSIHAILGYSMAKRDGLSVGGCGMDMGFSVVYNLSATLYGAEGGGYKCLGKGRCPSNYHSNHHDRIRCEGTRVHNPDGPDTGSTCWAPGGLFQDETKIPKDWPRLKGGRVASCITDEKGENPVVCKKCKGEGWVLNPEGPQRFDLVHTDGYALKHRWL